jgi:polysaccharide deacetylase 2 family uncharacterized protein YibQ
MGYETMEAGRRAVLAGLLFAATQSGQANPITGSTQATPPRSDVTTTTPPAPASVPAQAVPVATTQPPADATAQPAGAAATPSLEAPPYKRFAVAPPNHDGKPIICIVIDDLGVMMRGTERAVALPAPMTLSWFPFARNLPTQINEAMARGHETTLHMPMQSFSNSTYQTGPDPLRIDLPPDVNLERLRAAMDAVPNAVGLNNHMGSVATRDAVLMALVAQEAKARGMMFLDSLTIGGSQGWRQAAAAGVPSDARDIFIDNSPKPEMIKQALLDIEAFSRRHGHVIAIGHPRPHTLDALEEWMPTLAEKGFVLWPLAATIEMRAQLQVKTAHV